jgi:hypothetical protein
MTAEEERPTKKKKSPENIPQRSTYEADGQNIQPVVGRSGENAEDQTKAVSRRGGGSVSGSSGPTVN